MIVLTAATPWEMRPLRGLGVPVWETGVGPAATKAFLDGRGDATAETVVISSGFAGALQPGMRTGDLVMDPLEAPVAYAHKAREIAESLQIPLHMGKIHSVDKIMTDPRAKRALGESLRAAAVDMETQALREWCRGRGATALAIRVVLDEIGDSLPAEMPVNTSVLAGARFALSRPASIPMLLRLGLRQKRAMATLVSFLRLFLPSIPNLCENPDAEEA